MGISIWTDEQIETARRILGGHDSIDGALPAISAALRRPVTRGALKAAFTSRGMLSPAHHTRRVLGYDSTPPVDDRAGIVKPELGSGMPNSGTTRVVVIPDTHIPYHDSLAWETALEAVRVLRPDVLVIIGDFADCYEISDFPKNPERKHNFASEMAAVNVELDRIDALRVPDVRYLLGNHEDRLDRLVAKRAPELHGFVSIEGILGLKRRGYEVVPYGDITSTGKIKYAHDFGRCGKNAASQSLGDAGHNIVFGHTHQAQCQYGGLITGERHVGWSMGWLGDYESLAFSYKRKWKARREWTHGIGTVTLDEIGNGWVQFHPIISGRVIVDGRMISGRRVAA